MTDSAFNDHFSAQASHYAAHRPRYPDELFSTLAELAPGRSAAWDCATGSGQAAAGLARCFDRVVATDASAAQIERAAPRRGVDYRVARAEASGLDNRSVDLVTVAQALHWFDLDRFYAEVRRVCRTGGVVAVWTYDLCRVTPNVDAAVDHLYHEHLANDWPPERAMVEARYRDLPFPFARLPAPDLTMEARWALDDFAGFLRSWSAVQRNRRRTGHDPVDAIEEHLAEVWGEHDRRRAIHWPLTVVVGRV